MKIFSRNCKLWALALAVAIVAAVMLPATTAQAAQGSAVSYPELTPEMEKYMEDQYWLYIVSEAQDLTKGIDGFSKREAVQIVAIRILDRMEYYPGGEKGDVSAREWQRHWGDFFSRIARGEFTKRELRRAFRTWRSVQHRAHHSTRHRHSTTRLRGIRYRT